MGYIATRPLCPRHGTVGRLRHGQLGHDTALRACGTVGGHDHDTAIRARAPGRACAHLGVLAGSAGCAFGAPSLFLDSVLFLSH